MLDKIIKWKLVFYNSIKLSIWSPEFPESSHSSLVCLASEHMEKEKITQEARDCLEKLYLEGNDGERRVVFFEGVDEIRGACVKAAIRDIDGCEKGDCSFWGTVMLKPAMQAVPALLERNPG